MIFNSIIKSQFSYRPLVLMSCSRTSNNLINKVHEMWLRIILNDYSIDFKTLLKNNNDICNHHRNIKALLIVVFKMKNGLVPPAMESILNKRFNTYNLRNFQKLSTERERTVWYGLETLSYRHPHIWSLLPQSLKEMNSLSQFKRKNKYWICRDCPCRLCKVYSQTLDFYNVKSYASDKLANLATISEKFVNLIFVR